MRRLASIFVFSLLSLVACDEGAQNSATPSSTEVAATQEPLLHALFDQGRLDELAAILEERMNSGAISLEDSLLLAETRVTQEELPKAIKVLKETLKSSPGALEHSLLLGRIYTSIDQNALALSVLVAAEKAGGEDARLATELGLAYGRNRDMDAARKYLVQARELGANSNEVDYNLSLIMIEQGDVEEARDVLAKLLEKDTTQQHVRRELAHATMLANPERWEEVRNMCNVVLEVAPEDWRAWELLADVELYNKDYLAAQTYYTSALEFGSKEIGRNPARVEEKYTVAALALKSQFEAEGLIPKPEDQDNSASPPLPTGYLERQREARRKAIEEQRAAAERDDKPSTDGSEQGN